jgi:DNA-binding response OmpR family regulator
MMLAKLRDRVVLVVEDEYYLASDVSRLIASAGARVLGPFPAKDQALAALESERPDCAVLDIHLGQGACFDLADRLRLSQVPFLFFTGYDRDAIPDRFADVTRLEKPTIDSRLVEAVADLCRP